MASLSDRQKVLVHLVKVGAKFDNCKDMMTYLSTQLADRRSDLKNEREYLQTVIQSGYASGLAGKLYDDYKNPPKTVAAAATKKEKSEPIVKPDPPQDLIEDPETITDPDVLETK